VFLITLASKELFMKNRTLASYFSSLLVFVASSLLSLCTMNAHALPAFANQTGHNCVACHAGGQFPELTPYGRIFKMTGYTIGEKSMQTAVMAVAGASRIKNLDAVTNAAAQNGTPLATPINNGKLDIETASVMLGGRIADNIGAFIQFTADNGYGAGNQVAADNMDIRYADQIVTPERDLIYGFSLNNDPSVSDPWNTAPAWNNYVPAPGTKGANAFTDSTAAYGSNGINGSPVGLTTYAFLNKTWYGEVGLYRSATNLFSFFQTGQTTPIYLNGTNPYWRVAYNKEWGPNSLMVGALGMTAHTFYTDSVAYPNLNQATGPGDPGNYVTTRFRGVDMQYQYLLDPHTVTVQVTYQNQNTGVAANDTVDPPTSVNVFRAKGTYVYQAKYGASYSYFNATDGSSQGSTAEVFYIPIQNVRVGLQYTAYSELSAMTLNGASASDANTMRFYVWAAY
jgi:hypothetical protein